MRPVHVNAALVAASFTFGSAAFAHHGFATEFDRANPVRLTGTVTKVEWVNPHVRFYMDVPNARGEAEQWAFELGSPNRLRRRGWSQSSLQIGELVTVAGVRAKDGSRKSGVRTLTLPTGKELPGALRELK